MTQTSALALANEPADPYASAPFLVKVRGRTKHLHACAERSGVISDLLHNRAELADYALLLRNLLPAYVELETGLGRHLRSPAGAGLLADRRVFRSQALRQDLSAICGPDWSSRLRLLPVGKTYARHVYNLASGSGAGLIAHAYVRYLGDLSGGQIVKKLLQKNFGMTDESLAFYAFPEIDDLDTFREEFRLLIEQAAGMAGDAEELIEEACLGFELNIRLSEEVQMVSRRCAN